MKKSLILMLTACFIGWGPAQADNVLTVSDVNVPQGGQATIEIGCDFDTEFTAFELQLSLPEGLSLLEDEYGKPVVEKAFEGSHAVSGNLLPSNGNYKFTCYSTNESDLSMPVSGALIRVTLKADAGLAVGSEYVAKVTASEFTRTADSKGENLDDVSFTVHIVEFRTVLDENATTEPIAENNANVRVRRTIKAGEWSTICLPFALTEAQVKAAFDNDVLLGDFNDYVFDDVAGTISVNFQSVKAIEANHPYIIKVSTPISEFTADGVDIDPQEAIVDFDASRRKNQPRQFVGTYVANTVLDWGTLFLSDNQFWYSTGSTMMKGFRGYFNLIDLIPDFENNYESRVSMVFDDGSAAGIHQRMNTDGHGAVVFDLQGRRVDEPKAKGIYIVNGKKVKK